MLNPANGDPSHAVVNYVEEYLDLVESLPFDLQRSVSLMKEIDAKYQGKKKKTGPRNESKLYLSRYHLELHIVVWQRCTGHNKHDSINQTLKKLHRKLWTSCNLQSHTTASLHDCNHRLSTSSTSLSLTHDSRLTVVSPPALSTRHALSTHRKHLSSWQCYLKRYLNPTTTRLVHLAETDVI